MEIDNRSEDFVIERPARFQASNCCGLSLHVAIGLPTHTSFHESHNNITYKCTDTGRLVWPECFFCFHLWRCKRVWNNKSHYQRPYSTQCVLVFTQVM